MKGGTEYAKRVRRLYKKLSSESEQASDPEPTDPLEQLMLGLLGWEASEANAAKALRELKSQMTDLNEVRVSSVHEINTVIRRFVPNGTRCARCIRRSLNSIFEREHRVSLDVLVNRGRREARQYLDSLDGITPYAVASVMLWSLGAHGIPVSQRLLDVLRERDLVEPEADLAEVQAFLERNVPAANAKSFCRVMQEYAEQSDAERAGKGTARAGKSAADKKKTTRGKKKKSTKTGGKKGRAR